MRTLSRPIPLAVVTLATLAGCIDEPALESETQAVVAGALEPGHLETVRVSTYDPVRQRWNYCSGSMLGPRTVLTAAHCFAAHDGYVVVDGDRRIYDRELRRWIIDAWAETSTTFALHPGYTDGNLTTDVAVVTLPAAVPFVAVAALGQSANPGAAITVVGFGATAVRDADGNPYPGYGETRRSGGNTIDPAPGSFGDSLVYFSAPGATTCAGDSGGPTFADAGGAACQIAVHVGAHAACTGFMSIDVRVDSGHPATHDWIRAQAAAVGTTIASCNN